MRRRLFGGLSGLGVLGVMLVLAPVAFAATPVPLWPGASELSLPAGANATAAQSAALNAVVCPSRGGCVAVGDYKDTTGGAQALVATQSGSSWQASELTLPANASTSAAQNAALNAVSCPSAGNCAAVGHYKVTTGSVHAMVATQTSGGPWQASDLTLPANANTSAGGQGAVLGSMSCQSAGHCVAAGHYIDQTGSFQALLATQAKGGAWQASELTLPANANTTATVQADLSSVVCPSAGTCVATGAYADTTGSFQALLATQSSGGPWQASELTLPANADTTAGAQNAFLSSVVCPSQGTCVAGGSYKDPAGNGQALIATQSPGGPWQASALTLPANADTAAGDQNASVKAVVCTSQGNCVAAGSYDDTMGSRQVMVATQSGGGAWQTSELTQPANTAAAGGQNALLNSLACPSAGYCTAAGFYKDATGSFQALVVSSAAPLAVATSSLPSGADGSAYSQQLAATGGAGGGTWALSAGSLPSGLSLNASTGVISGVPSALGVSHFAVTVTDPGPPVQHASAQLSIAVGPAPPAPPARIRLVKVKTSGSLVTLTLSCDGSAGQRCSGTLKLSTREHLTGHTITALTASTPKKSKKPKKKKLKKTIKTVTLASTTYAFTGASRTLKITLNKTGKRLLAKYHKLAAKLTLTPTGARTPASTKTITIRATHAQRKHH